MFQFTVGWLAFEITGQPGTLALIHFVAFLPRLPLTLFGGVFADRWDQRKLIIAAQAVSAAAILTIATLTATGSIQVWHLIAGAFLLGVSQAIDEPSRTAFFPRLLPDRSHIPSAVPLISMAWSTTRIVAPSIAGFVIAAGGASTSFFVSAAGAATMVTLLRILRITQAAPTPRGNVWQNMVDGFKYVRRNEVFANVIMAAFVFATFTMGYALMLPVFAKDILDVDSRGLGILAASSGVGSFFALGTFNILHKRFKPGTVVIFGLTLFSLTLIGFAFSNWFWLSLILLTGTGMAHIYFQTSANVIIQTLVDDEYRGRVMALYGVLWSLLLLSATLLNFAAELIGPRFALAGGAGIVLAYVWLILVRSAALRNLSLETKEDQTASPSAK